MTNATYHFSTNSEHRLITCHPYLILLSRAVIQEVDFTVVCGWRGQNAQDTAVETGHSKVTWPSSKHNHMLGGEPYSLAIDVAPYDHVAKAILWDDVESFALLAGYFKAVAFAKGIELRWGHDWNNNNILSDEAGKFIDRPHFELVNVER